MEPIKMDGSLHVTGEKQPTSTVLSARLNSCSSTFVLE